MKYLKNRSLCYNIAKNKNIQEDILNKTLLPGRRYKSSMVPTAVEGGIVYNCYDVIVNSSKRRIGLISYSSLNGKNPDYMVAVISFEEFNKKEFTPEEVFNHNAIASNAIYTKDALEAINLLSNNLVYVS